MEFFSDLSLKRKLFLVFGLSVFFISAIIAVSVAQMHWMKRSTAELFEKTAARSRHILNLRSESERARRALLQMVLERDGAGRQAALTTINEATGEVDRELALLMAEDPDYEAALLEFRETWEEFKHTRDFEIIPMVISGRHEDALAFALKQQERRFREFTAIAGRLLERSDAEVKALQALMTAKFHRTINGFIVISLAGFALAVVSIRFLARDLGGRFSKVLEAVGRFQSGDTRVKVEVAGSDEVGELREALNGLFAQIHEYRISQEQYMSIMDWERSEKEKKRAELERSNERFRNLVESTSDWVWEVDANGVYTYASPRVEDMLGYSPEDVMGKTPFDFMPADEAERLKGAFKELAKKASPFTNLENRNVHKDGSVVTLETNGTPFFDGEGRLAGYRGVDRDITRRKAAEEEKANLSEYLTQTEKLASIGQLAAGVAHEINNPLGYVRSNLRTLSEYLGTFKRLIALHEDLEKAYENGEFEEIAELRASIEALRKEADLEFTLGDAGQILVDSNDGVSRIGTIVKGLKDFSYAGAGETGVHDINECINDALRIGRPEIKNKAEVVLELCDPTPVRCRPQQLTQVFLNIIVNAAQVVGEGGRISVRTFKVNGYAFVEIIDNGPGMSEEVKKRIFDPFFTTKPVGKGTGLGLYIAYGIVKEHGGSMNVASQPGQGARFSIKLPLSTEAASAA